MTDSAGEVVDDAEKKDLRREERGEPKKVLL